MEKNNKLDYLKVFVVSFFVMLIIQLPEMMTNGGYFVYGGDYSFQMIPFYHHGVETVRDGTIGWDWSTGIGTDFIGSYGYYFLGSPFFWLLCLFEAKTAVFMMPFFTALKVGVAALTSYIYMMRHIKNKTVVFISAFIYSFSGYQLFNVVYYFFNDVTALFPLLLLSFDMLVKENKRGFFAVMTAIMAFTNYYFFFGQVVFVIIYYVINCIKKEFRFTLKSFTAIFLEAVLGVCISCVLLIPTILAVTSGSRVSDVLYGTDLLSYSDNAIIPKIVQSLFISPDSPSYAQLFLSSDNTHNWASISLYIPFFAGVGVFSYIRQNKKSPISILLVVCAVMACVPFLNSMFYLFNVSYYARWFYMPLLFMCIATGKCLDDDINLRPGIIFQGIGLVVLSVIALFPEETFSFKQKVSWGLGDTSAVSGDGVVKMFKMCKSPTVFWQNIAFGVIYLLLIFVYIKQKETDKKILKKMSCIVVGMTFVTSYIYMSNSIGLLAVDDYNEKVINFEPQLEETDEFYRISDGISSGHSYNLNVLWHKNAISIFHSIMPVSADHFYRGVSGQPRMMREVYDENDYPVFSLLSNKYTFSESTNDDLNVEHSRTEIQGFELYDKQEYYYIYENKYYIPIGFMYDYCISESKIDEYLDSMEFEDSEQRYNYKQQIMLRALVLKDEDVANCSEMIDEIPQSMIEDLDEETYYNDCRDRKSSSCYSFVYDEKGFNAKINAQKSGPVFFSVPYSEGWSAEVNGEEANIMVSHYGLMSVVVQPGENHITFSYETPGLKDGMYITFLGIFGLVFYSIFCFFIKRGKYEKK